MARIDPRQLARQLQDWADKPANERHYHSGQLQQIEAALADPRRTTQLAVASFLLGTWHLGHGQARVLQGDADGWDEARLGLAFQRTSLLGRSRRQTRSTRHGEVPDLPVLPAANCVALGLALADPDGEELFAKYRALPDACFDQGSAWPLFVRQLLALREGLRPVVTPRLEVYADVLSHWTGDEAVLARRLADLLDCHFDRTRSLPGSPAEFEEPGVLVCPVEVLAVRSVRLLLDLPMPKVDHALMFTNLGTIAPRGAWPQSPLLARIERALRP